MNSGLIIIGSAPCFGADLLKILNKVWGWDYMAIGLDAIDKHPGRIEYMATYHPLDIKEALSRRAKAGGNTDYKVISHQPGENIDIVYPYKAPSGSSALFGALAGIKLGYDKIILCGCPMDGAYEQFRQGWQAHLDEYVGKVRSMSGWTKNFLGEPAGEWLAEE